VYSGDFADLAEEPSLEPTPSLDAMTSEERASITQADVLVQAESSVISVTPLIFAEQTRRLLDKSTAWIWPRVIIKMLWCENSVYEMMYARWEVEKAYEIKKAKGEAGRMLQSFMLPTANHFVRLIALLFTTGSISWRVLSSTGINLNCSLRSSLLFCSHDARGKTCIVSTAAWIENDFV